MERFLYFVSGGDSDLVKQCFEDLNSKNFFEVPKNILEKIQENFSAGFTSEKETGKMIKTVLQESDEILDTHTAVALKVAREFEEKNIPMVIASTAHYAKFAPAILEYLGENFDANTPEEMFERLEKLSPRMEMHPDLKNIFSKPILHTDTVAAEKDKIIEKILKFVEK